MGKAIYNPKGKAGEYANWACNLHVGCSNNCDYCYCKKGVLSSVAGKPQATLKKCFRDEAHALEVFRKELTQNATTIKAQGGLFFSFSTDPCLPETFGLTLPCVLAATELGVPCQILTKCTEWWFDTNVINSLLPVIDLLAIGFTLTGMDSMERGRTVATNQHRLRLMEELHSRGFRTFASFEPIVDVGKSMEMFYKTLQNESCDLYKFGLMSGKKDYDLTNLEEYIQKVNYHLEKRDVPVYWKESVRKAIGHDIVSRVCVNADYNIFQKRQITHI